MGDNTDFGRLLKALRKARDWTQERLAEEAHCATETIRKLERGKLRPSVHLAGSIADALRIPPEERAGFIAIARGIPPSTPAPRTDPPQSYNNAFTGRETELESLRQYLQDPTRRLITLTGIGGVGKTRLAFEAARSVLEDFPDGVHFVPLASVESAQFLVTAIANILSVNLFSTSDVKAQLINYLKPKTLLLVLDNFEQLLSDHGDDLLNDLLVHAPRLKLLVTSRERLNLHSEWVFKLEGLAVPASGSAMEHPSPAMDLFFLRALQINPKLSHEANTAVVAEICRRLYGLPLAIELAASWLYTLSCHQVLKALQDDQSILMTNARDIPERHRSLYTVFDHSWRLLTVDERRCLATLTVFRGPFRLEAAQAVAALNPFILRQLVDKSLVRIESEDYYDLHELLRQYLETHLTQSESEDARDRHLRYYAQLTEALSPDLENANYPSAMLRLERSYPNIRTALEWSLSSPERAALGLRLIGAIYWFWQLGHIAEGRYWHEAILQRIPPDTATVEIARVLHGAAAMSFMEGDLTGVVERCLKSIEISRVVNDTNGLGNSLLAYGFTLETLGEIEQALALYDEVDGLLLQLGKPHLRIGTFSRLCAVALGTGHAREARHYIEQIAALNPNGNVWSLAFLWLTHGEEKMYSGNFSDALPFVRAAFLHWQKMNDKLDVFLAHRRLAECLTRSGNLDQAVECYQDMLEHWRELGNKPGMAAAHCDLAYVFQQMHRLHEAGAHMIEGLNLYMAANFRRGFSYVAIVAAHLLLVMGKPGVAACVLGTVDSHPTVNHLSMYLPIFVEWEPTTREVERQLGSEVYTAHLAQGRSTPLAEVIRSVQAALIAV